MVALAPYRGGPAPDLERLRGDFPLLDSAAGRGLHYLDNAATTLKPQAVIDALAACYREFGGPVHRGLYPLAQAASAHYEQARATVARFIGAPAAETVVFTRSATESLNLVAQGWARARLEPGDELWVSRMEHHANFLPWQRLCRETGARLRIIELDDDHELDLAQAGELFGPRTRLLALTQLSNVLGVVNPIAEIVREAGRRGIAVVVDAAQAVAQMPLDVAALGCDFLAFSAHKLYGPTGIGVLYAAPERLDEIEPLLLGGGMVERVDELGSDWAPPPARLEAGSPDLAGAVGLAAAIGCLERIGMARIEAHGRALAAAAFEALAAMPGVRLYGPRGPAAHAGILSFNIDGIHPHDLAQIAGERGVALRAGHHCCQPLMHALGVAATVRASFALYNGADDIAALVDAIAAARRLFGRV